MIDAKSVDAALERKLDEVIAGTLNTEPVAIGGRSLVVRAVSEQERDAARTFVVASVRADLGVAELDEAAEFVVAQRIDRLLLARCVLDPVQLARGIRAPALTLDEIEDLAPSDVVQLLTARSLAQRRAFPPFDDQREADAFTKALVARGKSDAIERTRAQHQTPAEFFGLDSTRELTSWAWFFFQILRGPASP